MSWPLEKKYRTTINAAIMTFFMIGFLVFIIERVFT